MEAETSDNKELEVTQFDSGAVRGTDKQQYRYDLICPRIINRLAETYHEGSKKYGDFNWCKGMPIPDVLTHIFGHLMSFMMGDETEDHLAHAAWNIGAIMHFQAGCQHHRAQIKWREQDADYLRINKPVEMIKAPGPQAEPITPLLEKVGNLQLRGVPMPRGWVSGVDKAKQTGKSMMKVKGPNWEYDVEIDKTSPNVLAACHDLVKDKILGHSNVDLLLDESPIILSSNTVDGRHIELRKRPEDRD